mgnify:FL=1
MARKTCSDTATSHRTGQPIFGIAAMLQNMSDAGGPDKYRHDLATAAGRAGGLAVLEEQERRNSVRDKKHLKVVG